MYKTIEALGPEHEFSVVNDDLKALPIVDRILKDLHGRFVNSVAKRDFTFGKELQMHVVEIKPNFPFESPVTFEENMHRAVLFMSDFVFRNHNAHLLGTGMHPLLRLEETNIWPHRDRQIYKAYGKLFDLHQHGWLNIQSFQLNLPYATEQEGIKLHNLLANVIPYLPAVTASSPIYETKFGYNVDNRLHFYKLNQHEVHSVTGDVIPEYVSSLNEYRQKIIEEYSSEMAKAGADKLILHKDWVNSRGVIFRFDRKAVEIRVMDEQECIKSDVAISCYIRALLRGLLNENPQLLPHEILVKDYNSIVTEGLKACPTGRPARAVCQAFYEIAWKNADQEEKRYLPLIKKRIDKGNLSETIRKAVQNKAQKTSMKEAIISVYSKLSESLIQNQPYL